MKRVAVMTTYHMHMCKLWCSGKDLALSFRGPRFKSRVKFFFTPFFSSFGLLSLP